MTQPLVSIVLPVYNGADYLAESIESCIAQTYQNWELIIVNDCSTDNSFGISESFALKDKRIRVIDNAENLKLPASLNRGFRETKGEYLTWTSHDNRMHPKMLEVFVDYLETYSDVGFLVSSYTVIDEKGKELYDVNLPNPAEYMPLFNPVGYAFMYRRGVYEKVGEYAENLFLVEDYEYWVRVWLHFKVAKLQESYYYTRVHGATLTALRKKEIAQKLLEMRLNYFGLFYKSLKNNPDLLFKYFASLVDNADGKEKLSNFLKCSKFEPVKFGVKYAFFYAPKELLKKTRWYKPLKEKYF